MTLATWPSHDHIFLYLARRDSTRKPIAQTDEMVDIAIIDWLGSLPPRDQPAAGVAAIMSDQIEASQH